MGWRTTHRRVVSARPRRRLLAILGVLAVVTKAVRQGDEEASSQVNTSSSLSLPPTTSTAPAADHACCMCPANDCDAINVDTQRLVDALEAVVPGAWFFIKGTLIAALRYGELCHVLSSGKKNLVDIDADVAVIVAKDEKKRVLEQIGDFLSKWNWKNPGPVSKEWDMYQTESPTKLTEESCTDIKVDAIPFRVDFHMLFSHGDHLLPEDATNDVWENLVDSEGLLSRQGVFPLQPCRWNNHMVNCAPKDYIHQLTNWQRNRYGDCNTIWRPIEDSLANAGRFSCSCRLSEIDWKEIEEGVRELSRQGLASFADCLTDNSSVTGGTSTPTTTLSIFLQQEPHGVGVQKQARNASGSLPGEAHATTTSSTPSLQASFTSGVAAAETPLPSANASLPGRLQHAIHRASRALEDWLRVDEAMQRSKH
eukprot:TRINITY_DN103732_c0_g1_i1.p1 TRINITY_DN103732_c0_g1~~TRINITY_DN103732_c0_g1_i1.p1  ORF type:complete len:424 (+),score=24.16 TRINITY_DN103732_c0_g1_i1:201-1472(+)